MEPVQIIIVILLFLVLFMVFALSMYLNSKTPLPENFELPSVKCKHCQSAACSLSQARRSDKNINEIAENVIKCEEGEE